MAHRDIRQNPRFVDFASIILHEDDDVIIVNKPIGLYSTPPRIRYDRPSLQDLAQRYAPEAQLAHRLDQMTTGALAIAKHAEAYRALSLQFQNREVEKTYRALVHGGAPVSPVLIDMPIAQAQGGKMVIAKNGRPSQTKVRTAETFDAYAVMECRPLTGRTHQVRVHLSYIGRPVVGDVLYGGGDLFLSDLKRKYRQNEEEDERPLNNGYVLHAHSLRLAHPATGAELYAEAPEPHNLSVCLKRLRAHNQQSAQMLKTDRF